MKTTAWMQLSELLYGRHASPTFKKRENFNGGMHMNRRRGPVAEKNLESFNGSVSPSLC